MALASFSDVKASSPFAVAALAGFSTILVSLLTINTILTKDPRLESVEACHSQTFTTSDLQIALCVLPLITSAGIKQHRHEDYIHNATCALNTIRTLSFHLRDQLVEARDPTYGEVLPSAVRRNVLEAFRAPISLSSD